MPSQFWTCFPPRPSRSPSRRQCCPETLAASVLPLRMPVLLVEVEILAVEAHAGRVLRERIDDHIERLCRRVARPLGVKPEGERERRLGGVRSWNTATSLAT